MVAFNNRSDDGDDERKNRELARLLQAITTAIKPARKFDADFPSFCVSALLMTAASAVLAVEGDIDENGLDPDVVNAMCQDALASMKAAAGINKSRNTP